METLETDQIDNLTFRLVDATYDYTEYIIEIERCEKTTRITGIWNIHDARRVYANLCRNAQFAKVLFP
jgi:hypothetical protein